MDRVCSGHWQATMRARPPLERRPLYSPLSAHPQGHLEMWVDILTPEQAAEVPPIEIAPPEPMAFELRVICWQVRPSPAPNLAPTLTLALALTPLTLIPRGAPTLTLGLALTRLPLISGGAL